VTARIGAAALTRTRDRFTLLRMAQPELVGSVDGQSPPTRQEQQGRSQAELDEPPAFDRVAIDRAYRYHRARRLARIQQRRESRFARLRFWSVVCGLLLICLVIGVTIWDQVQRLFGL
jgi:hypothetical protein